MLSYWLKCKKNSESKNSKVIKTKNGRMIFTSKCAICGNKKSKFVKEQKARRLLSKLTEIKLPILSDLPIENILF